MQSPYGVPEIQQFMADGGYSPAFSISTADIHSSSQPQKHHHHAHQLQPQQQLQQPQHHHQQRQQEHLHHHYQQAVQRQHNQTPHLHLHYHHPQLQMQQAVPPAQPQPFLNFHAFPITQQLFQPTHQFHLFQQEQQSRMRQQQVHLGLDQEPGSLGSGSPTPVIAAAGGGGGGGVPPFLGPVNFKLAVNESTGGGSQEGLRDEGEDVHDGEVSKSHIHPWTTGKEEAATKEPFWRPLDVDFINRNNRRREEEEEELEPSDSGRQYCKTSRDGNNVQDGNNSANNYKLFSELEAICMPGSGVGGGSSFGGGNSNQQTGSISVLTGEIPPPTAAAELVADGEPNADTADQGSNASMGEEAAPAPKSNKSSAGSSGSSRKRKRKQQLNSIATFVESLVRKLMEHQEGLHRKFLEVLERRDQERMNREETWRQHEAAKAGREAMARAQEQALASSREAAIISFLEKITGESLNLPTKAQFQSQLQEESSRKETTKHMEQSDACTAAAGSAGNADENTATNANQGFLNTSRWPKAEVQSLIRVRSSLEWRFQEPGLKGPLWEEVSTAMASMGYHRSAKRCKEKWENINKYFRKSRDSAKKRPQHSKTCTYFHQLDQLYSRPKAPPPPTTSSAGRDVPELQAAADVVSNEKTGPTFEFPHMGATRLAADNSEHEDDNVENEDGDEEGGEEEEGDDEGEGESH